MRRRSQVVRQRSAKPLFAGSIPAVASSIPLPPDFVLESTVESHGWYLLAPFRWSRREQILRRFEKVGGVTGELKVGVKKRRLEAIWTPHPTHVRGTLRNGGNESGLAGTELERRIRRMLQLEVDISPFIGMASRSESHSWVAAAGFGRLLCGTTLWEDAVKIIATTNTTWRQTVRMVELLVEKCGMGGAFPTPEEVARFSEAELQQDCRLGYRAKTIRALAVGISGGEIALEAIADQDQQTAHLYRSYQRLPGVGPYGAAHLLAMDGRHDFIAVDSEFRRFVRETHHGGRRVSDKAMLRRYAKWGRWKYLAYWSELWRSVAERLQPAAVDGGEPR
jgi:3-methyladenine DNA glycosylase/8-oxoguanine DNA glycosylase